MAENTWLSLGFFHPLLVELWAPTYKWYGAHLVGYINVSKAPRNKSSWNPPAKNFIAGNIWKKREGFE